MPVTVIIVSHFRGAVQSLVEGSFSSPETLRLGCLTLGEDLGPLKRVAETSNHV